jgi:Mrp family chromosome partitioning ATPase
VSPHAVYAASREQFQALGAAIGTSSPRAIGGRTLLVSGSSSQEGVTTTAINVARALAGAGLKVILVDGHLARPSIGPLFGVAPAHGLQDVIFGEVSLRDALVPVMPGVELLAPASTPTRFMRDMLAYEDVTELLAKSSYLVDWVIVDAPPVTVAGDAISYLQRVDNVLIVVRFDHTKLEELRQLTEAFSQYHVVPAGFVVTRTD